MCIRDSVNSHPAGDGARHIAADIPEGDRTPPVGADEGRIAAGAIQVIGVSNHRSPVARVREHRAKEADVLPVTRRLVVPLNLLETETDDPCLLYTSPSPRD